MYEDLVFPLILVLSVLFILVVPWLLYAGFRKIANPVPLRIPLLFAVVVLLMIGGIIQFNVIGKGNSVPGTILMFSLMLLLTSLAVITPYFRFGEKSGNYRAWLTFTQLSFIGVFLMFWTTLGESKEGGPLPLFSPLLPLTGWIFDLSAYLLNSGDIVYSSDFPVHTLLLAAGLYLEVFSVAGAFCLLLSLLSQAKNENRAAEPRS